MKTYDVVIIGGGAAGLSAAQYSARANLSTLVLEREAGGGQCNLISELENYPGFPEPIDGSEFAERFEEQAKRFGATIEFGDVEAIVRTDDRYLIRTDEEEIAADAVILATGARHRHIGVPGEEEFSGRGVSYCATCDGPMFGGKRMLVVGGGDAAFDEARFLSNLSDDIVLVHRREGFRAQAALIERARKDPHIEIRTNTVVEEILGAENEMGIEAVSRVRLRRVDTDEVYTEDFGAVFVFVGSIPQTDLVDFVDRDENGYVITDSLMQSSSPGLYAVGDVRTSPFRQLVVAAADGAIAAHAAGEYIAERRSSPDAVTV